MPENERKSNTVPHYTDEMTFYDSKNMHSSIEAVVKTEIYPEKRGREGKRATFSHPYTSTATPAHSHIETDPNGSYTGTPLTYGEKPVVDVDDL